MRKSVINWKKIMSDGSVFHTRLNIKNCQKIIGKQSHVFFGSYNNS